METTSKPTSEIPEEAVANETPAGESAAGKLQDEIPVAESAARARVKKGLEVSKVQARKGAVVVTEVVKGERKFDTEAPFVWLLRITAIVFAVLAVIAPVIETSLSGLLGFAVDLVVNLAAAFAIFATSNLIDVLYDIRDRV